MFPEHIGFWLFVILTALALDVLRFRRSGRVWRRRWARALGEPMGRVWSQRASDSEQQPGVPPDVATESSDWPMPASGAPPSGAGVIQSPAPSPGQWESSGDRPPTTIDTGQPAQRAARVQISVEMPGGRLLRVTVEIMPPRAQISIGALAWLSQANAPVLEAPFAWPPLVADLGRAVARRLEPILQPKSWPQAMRAALDVRDHPLAVTLFSLALLVYALTRFIGLEQFPIYFFSDEAVQTLLAADFVRDGFRDSMGRYFPTYFKNASFFNLSTSVYLQVIPYLLFGKSMVVTRGTSVLVSLFGAAAVGLALKNIFNVGWWWLGVLLLSITPAWFLHSRTAFETVIMVAGYAWFLYFYLLYRYRDPRFLFPALFCGALAFYSYNGGQLVVVLTGFLLLLSDFRYHWANRRVGGWGALFLGALLLPYLRFLVEQPGENIAHLRNLDWYWLNRDLTLAQKLGRLWQEYRFGLSPGFWYALDNRRDLIRHVMKGYGHIFPATAPFMLLGVLFCLRRINVAAYRALLISLLAAPVGGAFTSIGITRVLVFVIPAALVTTLGVEAARSGLSRRSSPALAVGVFALLTAVNFSMLRDALVNGPTWYRDYGLHGMQYGARQICEEIQAYLQRSPQTQIRLTPVWTNGAQYVLRFFMSDDPRVRLESLQGYAYRQEALTDDMLFIALAEEYQAVVDDPKFTAVRLERIVPYPDGRDGFMFVRLRYSDAAEALFAAEREARRALLSDQIRVNGETITVRYSRMDAGRIHDVFDDDTYTLGRTEEANPAIVELIFPSPRTLSGVTLTLGSMDLRLSARLYADEGSPPVVYEQTFTQLPDDPTVRLAFDQGPGAIARLRLEILDINESEEAKVHLREISLDQ